MSLRTPPLRLRWNAFPIRRGGTIAVRGLIGWRIALSLPAGEAKPIGFVWFSPLQRMSLLKWPMAGNGGFAFHAGAITPHQAFARSVGAVWAAPRGRAAGPLDAASYLRRQAGSSLRDLKAVRKAEESSAAALHSDIRHSLTASYGRSVSWSQCHLTRATRRRSLPVARQAGTDLHDALSAALCE